MQKVIADRFRLWGTLYTLAVFSSADDTRNATSNVGYVKKHSDMTPFTLHVYCLRRINLSHTDRWHMARAALEAKQVVSAP